ncbi:uncharacterized protein CDAR_45671 [Caerostris darwini]|uniref:Testis-expressed sequence 9 protein n=1 Tax=Caerostris darwini TaxID=1538125 RepID=A0AAV4N2Q5_9ARAC|nr:uncharacterized protein CDAR_45671 [Caerostris darwini]
MNTNICCEKVMQDEKGGGHVKEKKIHSLNMKSSITSMERELSQKSPVKKPTLTKRKTCFQKPRRKTHGQVKKYPEIQDDLNMDNNNEETDGVQESIFSENNIPPSSIVTEIVNNVNNVLLKNASGDKESKYLFDFGFKNIKDDMKTLIKQCVNKEDTIISLEGRLKDTEQNYSDLKKRCHHLEQKNEKMSKSLDETTKTLENTLQELTAANAFAEKAKQLKKSENNNMSNLEKRIGHLIAENEKLKSQVNTLDIGSKNDLLINEKKMEELVESNKLLTRQKAELREVVIKQMQLASNLRRQVLHLKAGLAQKFTEEGAMKIIEEFY